MQEETVQPQDAENSGKSVEEQLADARAQVGQQRDAMLRALADAENARKRYQAEAANSQKYAIERFAEALLPVVDSLEAALANKDASREALRDGVQLTLRQLTQALEKARRVKCGNPTPWWPPCRRATNSTTGCCARRWSRSPSQLKKPEQTPYQTQT